MSIVVMKFGGTSVGTIERIKLSAAIVAKEFQRGSKIIVVVSAMAGVTDSLVKLSKEVSPMIYGVKSREYDIVISSGEQIASGLMALALIEIGVPACSYQGWQIPINTDDRYSSAKVLNIGQELISDAFMRGEVLIVSGFQGINKRGNIVTLGRGGSDTTAVAIAASIGAKRCDIYTDVDGVYSADPRIIKKASKKLNIDYSEMLEMAYLGSKVLHPRCVSIAYNHNVEINVLSSFVEKEGTIVKAIEGNNVSGVSILQNTSMFKFCSKDEEITSLSSKIVSILNSSNIAFDMLSFSNNSIYATINSDNHETFEAIIKSELKNIEFEGLTGFNKISIIGAGIVSNPSILSSIINLCAQKLVKIFLLSTSEIKISFLIKKEYSELIVNDLHTIFELDKEGVI